MHCATREVARNRAHRGQTPRDWLNAIGYPVFTFAKSLLLTNLTRNRGQSPRGGVAECLLFSVADGRFDRKIERFEGLCPVVKAPFAPLATPLAGGGAGITSG
jgi:hypothetical protein